MDEAVKIQISTAIAERFYATEFDCQWTRDEKARLMKTAYEVLGEGICHRCTVLGARPTENTDSKETTEK